MEDGKMENEIPWYWDLNPAPSNVTINALPLSHLAAVELQEFFHTRIFHVKK